MLIIKTVGALRNWLDHLSEQISIGFVPTMGALHQGHITLIQNSKQMNGVTVCSIFVNPAQFNDPSDLAKYPRTFEEDVELLIQAGNDVLFYPSVDEVYPPDFRETEVDLQGLDLVLEGEDRPGHFQGVVKVVHRLLDIVKPARLYMGQKDFQQFTIIDQMIRYLKLPVQLVVCPIVRESNGLAMSSRNSRLSPEGRQKAGLIYQGLMEGKKLINTYQPPELATYCLSLLQVPGFQTEYFSIVDSRTLKPIAHWDPSLRAVACLAVWFEGVRLIDNEYYQ